MRGEATLRVALWVFAGSRQILFHEGALEYGEINAIHHHGTAFTSEASFGNVVSGEAPENCDHSRCESNRIAWPAIMGYAAVIKRPRLVIGTCGVRRSDR